MLTPVVISLTFLEFGMSNLTCLGCSFQIDAAIVRIMKTRKVLSHTLLITELFQQVRSFFFYSEVVFYWIDVELNYFCALCFDSNVCVDEQTFSCSSSFQSSQLIWRRELRAWLIASILKGTRTTLRFTITSLREFRSDIRYICLPSNGNDFYDDLFVTIL